MMFVGYTVPYWQLGNQFVFTRNVGINVIACCLEDPSSRERVTN